MLDGVYHTPEGVPVFHAARAPTAGELQALLSRIIRRIMTLLTRQGYLIEEQGMTYLAETDPEAALGPLQAAACTYRIALGPRAGQKVLTLQTAPSQEAPPTEQRCVNAQGFSLHAEVRCAINQRHKLESQGQGVALLGAPSIKHYLPVPIFFLLYSAMAIGKNKFPPFSTFGSLRFQIQSLHLFPAADQP